MINDGKLNLVPTFMSLDMKVEGLGMDLFSHNNGSLTTEKMICSTHRHLVMNSVQGNYSCKYPFPKMPHKDVQRKKNLYSFSSPYGGAYNVV